MEQGTINALLYLTAGASIIYLFQVRRRELGRLSREQLAEMDAEGFSELCLLLKTAYERMLYMGVLFIPLAWSSWHGGPVAGRAFFLILIALLFISNIPPRHGIIRLLERHGLSIADLRRKGIRV